MVELLENFAIVPLRVLRWPVSCTRPLLRIVWFAICLGGASGAIRAATCIVGFACDAMEVRFGTTERMSRTSRMRWPKGCTRFSTRSMRRMPRGLPVTRLLPPPCLVVGSCVVEKNRVLACLAFHAFGTMCLTSDAIRAFERCVMRLDDVSCTWSDFFSTWRVHSFGVDVVFIACRL